MEEDNLEIRRELTLLKLQLRETRELLKLSMRSNNAFK